ncbi:hypothetical protein GCM10011613_16950 [Cellvibrio zantedeschiae]|uniref:Uncharacterized protein n=1 Tax=Cellvibrio zantedeschiae TaxID=1237077 RepID=A0ABQ3B3T9_9GAMM|nr:hypothetical protein [Cellvibrio zantedeschiae]GGY72561.1 hypothetical protein GCM10011613_16950 [Cellvibrio zantedeschiae]
MMGIYVNDLRELIIRPALEHLNEWSQTAENLLLGTAAQESQLGFRVQSDTGDSLGIYGIKAQTHIRVWDEFLVTDPELASRLRGLASQQQFLKFPHQELITNLSYASGMAWMMYKRCHLKFPANADIHELASYWLNLYATQNESIAQINSNELTLEKFAQNYRTFVLRENKNLAA